MLLRGVLVASIVSTALSLQAQTYVFNRADFATGKGPSYVATADFNGDGMADIAVVNQQDATISILLGQQGGTFAPQGAYPVGADLLQLSPSDFNHDGKPDLVVTDMASNCLWVLLGKGDGTFFQPVSYAVGQSPTGVRVDDFNNDGAMDVAVVNSYCVLGGCTQGTVSILLGNGDGTFQPSTEFAVGTGPFGVAATDFNGDGQWDLAVTNTFSDTVSVLLGNGDGTFQTHVDYASPGQPTGIVSADFNGDKALDLVITHQGGFWALTLMTGNGDGTFQGETQIATNYDTYIAEAGDSNHDGKIDLVITNVSNGGAVLFVGNGNGTFQVPQVYTTGAYPVGVSMRDMNGDNNVDLVVANQQSNSVTVLLGNGNASFSPLTQVAVSLSNAQQQVAMTPIVVDANKDGKADLAIGGGGTNQLAVLLGNGDGSFQSPNVTVSIPSFSTMIAGDFNGDGYPDLACATLTGFAILLGNGNGTFYPASTPSVLASGPRGLVAGDFNNDRKLDLAVLGNGFLQSQPVYIFLGNGDGTFQPGKQTWSSNTVPMAIAAGDFNHDGKLDLVVNVNPNGIAVMLGDGDGTVQGPVLYPTDELPFLGLTVADLNGDGIPDIVSVGNQIDVFLGKGDGTFYAPVYYDGGNAPNEVITGDFNRDGKIDIIAAALGPTVNGDIEILFGNGNGTFQPRIEISDAAPTGGYMSVGDLNRDGTPDLVIGVSTLASAFLSSPMATLSPSAIDFGSSMLGMPSTPHVVTLTNSGNAPLKLSSASASADFTLTNNCGASVAPGSSCGLSLAFTPPALGTSVGTLVVADNAPRGAQSVSLSGKGVPGFSLSVASGSSNSATVKTGGTATYGLVVVPVGGFAQSVSFACTGSPAGATCNVSPTPVTLDGANAASINVTVSTTVKMSALIRGTESPFRHIPLLSSVILSLAFVTASPKLNRNRIFGLVLILAVLAIPMVACGGGGGGNGGGAGGGAGTPPGHYLLTVTANGGTGLMQSMQLSLTVN
jgi:VCBS repeat protein/transmembrane protein TMEM131